MLHWCSLDISVTLAPQRRKNGWLPGGDVGCNPYNYVIGTYSLTVHITHIPGVQHLGTVGRWGWSLRCVSRQCGCPSERTCGRRRASLSQWEPWSLPLCGSEDQEESGRARWPARSWGRHRVNTSKLRECVLCNSIIENSPQAWCKNNSWKHSRTKLFGVCFCFAYPLFTLDVYVISGS